MRPTAPPEPFATRYANERYLGEVAATDHFLEPLLAPILDGRDEPSLVVLTSDHGEGLGEHGELTHGLFAYESTLHVPLVVYGPGVAPGDRGAQRRTRRCVPHPRRRARPGDAGRVTWAGLCSMARGSPGAVCTSRRCRLTSTRGGRRSTACCATTTSTSTCPCRSCTTWRAIPRRRTTASTGNAGWPTSCAPDLPAAALAAPRTQGDLRGRKGGPACPRLFGLREAARAATWPRSRSTTTRSAWSSSNRSCTKSSPTIRMDGFAEAEKLAREVIAARPSMANGYEYLATVLKELGRPAEAVEVLELAVGRGVDHPSVDPSARARALRSRPRRGRDHAVGERRGWRRPRRSERPGRGVLHRRQARRSRPRLRQSAASRCRQHAGPREPGERGAGPRPAGRSPQAPREGAPSQRPAYPSRGTAWAWPASSWATLRVPSRPGREAVELDPKAFDALYNLGLTAAAAGRAELARRALTRYVATAPADRHRDEIRKARQVLAQLGV